MVCSTSFCKCLCVISTQGCRPSTWRSKKLTLAREGAHDSVITEVFLHCESTCQRVQALREKLSVWMILSASVSGRTGLPLARPFIFMHCTLC